MNTLEFCEKYLLNYTINDDGSIDVYVNVYLEHELGDMEKLPVKFGKVSGSFSCYGNNLTTLEGCPKFVGGYFNCMLNSLTSLQCCPKYIAANFGSNILTHHILGNVQGSIYTNTKQRIVI